MFVFHVGCICCGWIFADFWILKGMDNSSEQRIGSRSLRTCNLWCCCSLVCLTNFKAAIIHHRPRSPACLFAMVGNCVFIISYSSLLRIAVLWFHKWLKVKGNYVQAFVWMRRRSKFFSFKCLLNLFRYDDFFF